MPPAESSLLLTNIGVGPVQLEPADATDAEAVSSANSSKRHSASTSNYWEDGEKEVEEEVEEADRQEDRREVEEEEAVGLDESDDDESVGGSSK